MLQIFEKNLSPPISLSKKNLIRLPSQLRWRWFLWPSSGALLFHLLFVLLTPSSSLRYCRSPGFDSPLQIPLLFAIDPVGLSSESALWVVGGVLFTGDPTVDLSVPRRWGGEGLNRLLSFTCLFRSLEFFSRFSRSFDFDQDCDGAWSPDEAIIRRFFSVSHSLVSVSRSLLESPSSCEILWLVLSHGYVWGVSSLSVVARVLEVSVAACDETRDSIRVSLSVYVFWSWVLDCGSASLLPEEVCPTCPTALRVRGLCPLIPFPWAIDATLTPVCL
ncbi:hypothetical protein YC2023_094716 [Brassica napus]